jgi:HPt (histidine-containing phosphotransfer) domain-containing protein
MAVAAPVAMSQVLNPEVTLESVGNDPELLEHVMGMFEDDAPRAVDAIRSGVEQDDGRALERAAHYLKGSLAILGATTAVAMAASLERAGRSGDLSSAAQTLATLEVEVAKVGPALAELLASLRARA